MQVPLPLCLHPRVARRKALPRSGATASVSFVPSHGAAWVWFAFQTLDPALAMLQGRLWSLSAHSDAAHQQAGGHFASAGDPLRRPGLDWYLQATFPALAALR
jgi:hypothetical protein